MLYVAMEPLSLTFGAQAIHHHNTITITTIAFGEWVNISGLPMDFNLQLNLMMITDLIYLYHNQLVQLVAPALHGLLVLPSPPVEL